MGITDTAFSASQVVHATGAGPRDLQNWLWRDVVTGEADGITGGGSPGKHRRFSLETVLQIAVAQELIEVTSGMELKTAFWAAAQFALMSDDTSDGGWGGETEEAPDRKPGLPFHYAHGDTLLLVRGQFGKVVLVPKGKNERTVCAEVIGESYVRIDVGNVFHRVCGRLGLDPFTLQDTAYASEVARLRGNADD